MATADHRIRGVVFAGVLPRYEADGFDVYVDPPRSILPPFMEEFAPDAIALRDDKKVAIEIVRAGAETEVRLDRLRTLLKQHGDWELRIIYAPPLTARLTLPTADRSIIQESLASVELAHKANPAAALLIAWSIFEAAARTALPEEFGSPQRPEDLVEGLAFGGYVLPDEADALRLLGRLRNDAAHGRLDVDISPERLAVVTRAARTLLEIGGSEILAS